MRIKNVQDADQVRSLIGEQNCEGIKRAIADGASVWVFQSEDEINADPDLSPEEKAQCLKILREEKLGYAGWFRSPTRQPIPGLEPAPGYDSHGNSRRIGKCPNCGRLVEHTRCFWCNPAH